MMFIVTTNEARRIVAKAYNPINDDHYWTILWEQYESAKKFNNIHRIQIMERQANGETLTDVCLHDWFRPGTELAEELDVTNSAPDGENKKGM